MNTSLHVYFSTLNVIDYVLDVIGYVLGRIFFCFERIFSVPSLNASSPNQTLRQACTGSMDRAYFVCGKLKFAYPYEPL